MCILAAHVSVYSRAHHPPLSSRRSLEREHIGPSVLRARVVHCHLNFISVTVNKTHKMKKWLTYNYTYHIHIIEDQTAFLLNQQ